ncbi:MAG: type II secretion system protein [Candidatus Levyibacteriota bacterium]
MKNLHNKQEARAYTLIELLVVIFLLIIVGTLIVGILNSTIIGNAKSKIATDLGQNGNYALSIISDIVLNSLNLDKVTDASGTDYTSCTPTGITAKSLQILGFDGGTTVLKCDDIGYSPSNTISSNSASLLDTTRVKLVTGSCTFTCYQADDYSLPRIDVTFQLTNVSGTAYSDTAKFSTSLAVRNKKIRQ